jgi:catechol 2,3-dioxygenase-like lactoylglutathione lyase family enzyme
MTDTVQITFHLQDGATHSGEIGQLAIIHEAMDKLLPHGFMHNKRITVNERASGDLIYPDMFAGEVFDQYHGAHLNVTARALTGGAGEAWRNVGFDHLALSMPDRAAAVDFFSRGLGMQIMRDDSHISVVAAGTGNNALFFFDAEPGKPLTDGIPSRIHHIGFVVDNLEAAYQHLKTNYPTFVSDFTLLERLERWSMYGRIKFGEITFMVQLSEIKEGFKGFEHPDAYADIMYNYASRHYGVRFMPG